MSLSLDRYLARIGFEGPRDISAESLLALHRQHAFSIPYENIDVILGKPVSMEIAAIFDKLVTRQRGGWCYEQNGLLEWALRDMGFTVTRLCGSVRRALMGDVVTGNHLVLRVDIGNEVWIADVGFGGYFAEPYRLQDGGFIQGDWSFDLSKLEDGQWRFSNRGDLDPPDYDFHDGPANEQVLAEKCHWQQTSPESNFRKKLICSIATASGAKVLSDQRWTDQDFQNGQRLVQDETELANLLQQELGIHLSDDDIPALWAFATARQQEWEAAQER